MEISILIFFIHQKLYLLQFAVKALLYFRKECQHSGKIPSKTETVNPEFIITVVY